MNEYFFQGHFPQEPVMPGVLILEALAQTGAVAILSLDELENVRVRNKIFDKIVYDKKSEVAYYINSIEDLKELGVSAHGANEKIGSYNRIEEFKIILAAAEYEEGLYRCSIRSKFTPVVEIANKYGGGGHKFACGVKGLTLEKLNALIEDLKKCKKTRKNKKNARKIAFFY